MTRTDRLIRLAKSADTAIISPLWLRSLAAFKAENIPDFAQHIGVHRSTVNRWANLYEFYSLLRSLNATRARKYRKALRPDHWLRLRKRAEMYGLTGVECLDWLDMAYSEHMTAELLEWAVDADQDVERTAEADAMKRAKKLSKTAAWLRNEGWPTEHQNRRAARIAVLLEGLEG